MKKILYFIFIIILIGLLAGGVYWYFYKQNTSDTETTSPLSFFGFSPFNNKPYTPPSTTTPQTTNEPGPDTSTGTTTIVEYKVPKLRQLSTTPIAGMVASSTASSSLIRFVNRGTGHIYEADDLSPDIRKVSITTIPKIYESFGNKNATSFILRYLKDEVDTVLTFYTELRGVGTTTVGVPFELKGKYLSPDIRQIAVSPNGDKIFTWNIENGKGTGYVSSFDEKNKTKIVDTPITQALIDWPETNTVTLTTKASAAASGFMYAVDVKTAQTRSILGGIRGLTAKASRDFSKVIYSARTTNNFITSILDTKNNSSQEVIFKTLPEKCVWSTLRKNEVYCAVPTEIPSGIYPDDWYKGSVSFIDQIWHLDTTTGEVHLLANLLKLSDKLIDATDLTLDPKENFLYFINKTDLSLWALDLNQ